MLYVGLGLLGLIAVDYCILYKLLGVDFTDYIVGRN
jgi:hypothetical protein